jgi:hypothetical protein
MIEHQCRFVCSYRVCPIPDRSGEIDPELRLDARRIRWGCLLDSLGRFRQHAIGDFGSSSGSVVGHNAPEQR